MRKSAARPRGSSDPGRRARRSDARPRSARRGTGRGRRCARARRASARPRAGHRAPRSGRAHRRASRGRPRASWRDAAFGRARAACARAGTDPCCAHALRAPARSSRTRPRDHRAPRARVRDTARGSPAPTPDRPVCARSSQICRTSSASSSSPLRDERLEVVAELEALSGLEHERVAELVGASQVLERRPRVSDRELDEPEHPEVSRLLDRDPGGLSARDRPSARSRAPRQSDRGGRR